MKRLKDKVAIVTGAADGIGLAISQAFAAAGASVMMGDINGSKCQKEAEKILLQGNTASPIYCDVANTSSVNNLIKVCIEQYKQIDILVNNAAIAIDGNIINMPEEDWDKIMNTNLKSVFRCIQASLPSMLSHGGSVINVSSVQALRSWNNWTAYAAAKGAILSMTNQLAGQFGHNNIRFNCISPGAIATPMNNKRAEDEGEAYVKSSENQAAMLRFGQPKEVAMAAVYLASDESGFVSGENLIIDGGLCTLPRYLLKNTI